MGAACKPEAPNSDQAQNGPVFLLIGSSTGDRAACRCPLLRLRGAGVGALAFFEKTKGRIGWLLLMTDGPF